MKIQIKETVDAGLYSVGIPLYNRSGECLGIDYDNGTKQILLLDVSVFQAEQIKKQIDQYIEDKKKS